MWQGRSHQYRTKESHARPYVTKEAAEWLALDRKIRNQVRKAEKSSLTAAQGGIELVTDFYQVFSRNMRDLGTPVYPRSLLDERNLSVNA